MEKIFLVTQAHYGSGAYKPHCRWTTIDDKGFIEGETPVEDFGMYMILDQEVTAQKASEMFDVLLTASEDGEKLTLDEAYEKVHKKKLSI